MSLFGFGKKEEQETKSSSCCCGASCISESMKEAEKAQNAAVAPSILGDDNEASDDKKED